MRDLCAAVADLGVPPSAAERCWTAKRLTLECEKIPEEFMELARELLVNAPGNFETS
jgi:hypothetical protein